MEPEVLKNAREYLSQSHKINLAYKADAQGDNLSAALGLAIICKNLGKQVSVWGTTEGLHSFSFLPGFGQVNRNFVGEEGNLVVEIATPADKLDEFWYDEVEGGIRLHVTPAPGFGLKAEQVSTYIDPTDADLIIGIGLPSRDELHALLPKSQSAFNVPTINLDVSPNDSYWGEFNLVDIQTLSVCEEAYGLVKDLPGAEISADAATAFLTGIISQSNSFRHSRTSPQTFAVAGELVSKGARQQEIVAKLFKSNSLASLKLLSQALANLSFDKNSSLVTAEVNYQKFLQSGAAREDIDLVFKELVNILDNARAVMLLVQLKETEVLSLVYLKPPQVLGELQLPNWTKLSDNTGQNIFLGVDLAAIRTEIAQKISASLNLLGKV